MLTATSLALLAAAAQSPVPEAPAILPATPALQDDVAADPEWEGAVTVGVGPGGVERIVCLQPVPGVADYRAVVPWLCHPATLKLI